MLQSLSIALDQVKPKLTIADIWNAAAQFTEDKAKAPVEVVVNPMYQSMLDVQDIGMPVTFCGGCLGWELWIALEVEGDTIRQFAPWDALKSIDISPTAPITACDKTTRPSKDGRTP